MVRDTLFHVFNSQAKKNGVTGGITADAFDRYLSLLTEITAEIAKTSAGIAKQEQKAVIDEQLVINGFKKWKRS